MRSVPPGSFERLSALPTLWQAYLRTRRGKLRQPRMAGFDLDADRHVIGLHRALSEGSYQPGPFLLHVIRDPKVRLIAAAPIRDRVLHQALVGELGPHYEPSFIEHSYAVGVGRGPQRASLRYLAWLRQYDFRLALDIRRYFPSIRHEILLGLFAHRLRDRATLALLERLLGVGGAVYRTAVAQDVLGLREEPLPAGAGLPIGSYLSQWSGAFYLDGLDHYIKRSLRIPGYLRYMDDFVLFSDDQKQLEQAREDIGQWLADNRGLTLGHKRWHVQPCREPARFLGYRICRAGLLPGPKLRRRMPARLRAAAANGPQALERSIASYRGIFLF